VGVQATLIATETQIAYQNFKIRAFEVGEAAWVADFNDAVNFLELMHSGTGAQNYGGYNNPAYDALIDASHNEPDVARRAAILRQAEAMMLNDLPILPIYSYASSNVTNPRVTGFKQNVNDIHRVRHMCFAK
jgi:oligopeptide transport system substrate-binding protein